MSAAGAAGATGAPAEPGGRSVPDPAAPPRLDRRHLERRGEPRLAELSLPEVRRMLVTTALLLGAAALFLWMVRAVLVAGLLGAVAAAYMRPLYRWLLRRLRHPVLASAATLAVVVVPVAVALGYSYGALLQAAAYVQANEEGVATRLARALDALGLGALSDGPGGLSATARRWVVAAAAYGAGVPGAVRAALARGAVAASVLVFTVVYILTDAPAVAAYLRGMVSPRYAPLAGTLERNVRGVLSGALYGTLVTQAIKSVVVLVLTLTFDVPLPALLALLSFVIGFFPIVGSWTVYVPVAAWLFAFRGAPTQAVTVLVVGFLVNTVFVSMYLRPKLASGRSHVLNFYWMFVGLVTGVYALGLPGLVLGPAIIAVLKAAVDTVVEPSAWPALEHGDDAADADDDAAHRAGAPA